MTRDDSFRERFGPWALVIGGSEGLGSGFARALAARGLDLVLVARRAALLEASARRLQDAFGVRVLPLALDAAARTAPEDLRRLAGDREIGLLVCSAAQATVGPFLQQTAASHARMLDLNCRLAALLCHDLGGRMAARGRGGIVLMSSMAGFQGTAQVAHYAATKAYLRVLAEGLWEELGPAGVAVLGCCAGPTHTPTFDGTAPRHPAWLPIRVMEPEPVARAALAALGRQPVLVPGGANRLAVFLLHHLLPRRAAVRLNSMFTRLLYPLTRRG